MERRRGPATRGGSCKPASRWVAHRRQVFHRTNSLELCRWFLWSCQPPRQQRICASVLTLTITVCPLILGPPNFELFRRPTVTSHIMLLKKARNLFAIRLRFCHAHMLPMIAAVANAAIQNRTTKPRGPGVIAAPAAVAQCERALRSTYRTATDEAQVSPIARS